MPDVTATFARTMAAVAGMDLTEDGVLMDGAETVMRLDRDAEGRVSSLQHLDLLQHVRVRRPDQPALAAAYAAAIRPDDLGALGLAMKTAPTLRDSLLRVVRFFRLVATNAQYSLQEDGTQGRFVIEALGADHPALCLRNEIALAGFATNIARLAQGRIALTEARLRHAPCGAQADYDALFGCPVRFGAGEDSLVMPSALLDLDNRLGDASVSDFLTAHLEDQLAARPADSPLKTALLRRLTEALSDGMPAAAVIAREMGMSERTLFRRLAAEGLTFRDVVREAQTRLAQELLTRSDRPIAEIAFLTGFSEQSTFSRAFKRWVGEAPARYRQQAAGARA